MGKMKKIKWVRFLNAELYVSEWSIKRKISLSMTSPKEGSNRNQSGSSMVSGRRSGKEKISKKGCHPTGWLKQVIKTINKRFQEKSTIFSEKVKKGEDEIFGDMVASELKGLSCSILKVKFKHEVNNLIFKYQMLNLQQNAQPNPPIQSPPSTFQLTTPPSQSNGAVFMQNTNGRSFDCYDTSMSSNQWNS